MRFLFLKSLILLSCFNYAFAQQGACNGDHLVQKNQLPFSTGGYGEILPNGKIRGLRKLSGIPSFPLNYGITKEQYVELIQNFVDQQHGKSYRHLGNYMDFFHGHLLIEGEGNARKAVGILYHTQEFGHWNSDPSCKYTRFAKEERNWFQSLENPAYIINANSLPGNYHDHEHFLTQRTIHPYQLFDGAGKTYYDSQVEFNQVNFFEVACENVPRRFQTKETSFFTLNVKGQPKCFVFAAAGDNCGHPPYLDDAACDASWIDPSKE